MLHYAKRDTAVYMLYTINRINWYTAVVAAGYRTSSSTTSLSGPNQQSNQLFPVNTAALLVGAYGYLLALRDKGGDEELVCRFKLMTR